jgi:hypothetical protein
MKKIFKFIKFILWANIFTLFVFLVAFTMISFIYFYYQLKQDPMHYFSWWWGKVSSFGIMEYKFYLIAMEIAIIIVATVYFRRNEDTHSGHEDYK